MTHLLARLAPFFRTALGVTMGALIVGPVACGGGALSPGNDAPSGAPGVVEIGPQEADSTRDAAPTVLPRTECDPDAGMPNADAASSRPSEECRFGAGPNHENHSCSMIWRVRRPTDLAPGATVPSASCAALCGPVPAWSEDCAACSDRGAGALPPQCESQCDAVVCTYGFGGGASS